MQMFRKDIGSMISRLKNDKSYTWFWNRLSPPFAIISSTSLNLVMKTSKTTIVNHRDKCGNKIFKPAIYICWHEHLPLTLYTLGQVGLDRCGPESEGNDVGKVVLLMQSNPYMNTIAAFTERLGLKVVRGGGKGDDNVKAVEDMKQLLDNGQDVLLAVDGPSGPIHKVKRGCIDLAQYSGAPIIHVSYTCARGIVLDKRWDKMLHPNLFDDIKIHFGKPLYVKKSADIEEAKSDILRAYLEMRDKNEKRK